MKEEGEREREREREKERCGRGRGGCRGACGMAQMRKNPAELCDVTVLSRKQSVYSTAATRLYFLLFVVYLTVNCVATTAE